MSPGRHALFGSTARDRALCVTPGADGWTWRLVVSTRSWFDLPGVRPPRRPDLVALAARLNEREGTAPEDACAWRAQPPDHPSPELWFGGSQHPDFAEHADVLAPSRLDPVLVLGAIHAALGAPRRRSARRVPRPAALADPG